MAKGASVGTGNVISLKKPAACKRCREVITEVCQLHDACPYCKQCCDQADYEQVLPYWRRQYVRVIWWRNYLLRGKKNV